MYHRAVDDDPRTLLEAMITRVRDLHRQGAKGYCVECGVWPCATIQALVGEWNFIIPEGDIAAAFREQFALHGVRPGDRLRILREAE